MFNIGNLFRRKESALYNLHFNDGPFVYNPNRRRILNVRFLLNGKLEYEVTLNPDQWGKANKRYYAPWEIEITDEDGAIITNHQFDLTGRSVRINIDSKSLGDTLSWIPQVDRFTKAHPGTKVYCGHFWPELGFTETYPDIHFIKPETTLEDIYATYVIGFYFSDETEGMHPADPRTMPLAKVAADILGQPYEELKPLLPETNNSRSVRKPTVCFAMESTSGCKLWQHPGGWQRVIDFLNEAGYQPVLIQKGTDQLDNITNKSGDFPIQDRIADIRECEFFIGLGSGLSWLAWALEKKVVLISGFSEPYAEFEDNCYRVINMGVCHGCWNDIKQTYDRGDWDWCPHHKGTDRQFECSKAITPGHVISAIQQLIADQQNPG